MYHLPYHADATNDPLVGTQEHPDSTVEQEFEPASEAAPWPTAGAAEKSHRVAAVLGILLGGVGMHRFYLGYTKVAAFQLSLTLLCFAAAFAVGLPSGMELATILLIGVQTSMVVWIWGAVEGVMILFGMLPHDGRAHPLR